MNNSKLLHLNHPERLNNEFFLGNFTIDAYDNNIGYTTKRLGKIAYDIYGNVVNSRIYPVFVKQGEVNRNNVLLNCEHSLYLNWQKTLTLYNDESHKHWLILESGTNPDDHDNWFQETSNQSFCFHVNFGADVKLKE